MKAKQVLPYIAALFFLAWSLGTLARNGSSGGGLLVNSYWLLYLAYLFPVVALGGMIVLIVILVLEWKVLSDAIGLGLAVRRQRTATKKRRTVSVLIGGTVWVLALFALYYRCGGLACRPPALNVTQTVSQAVTAPGTPSPTPLPLASTFVGLANFVSTEWFVWPFVGLIVISGIILGRAVLVSMNETKKMNVIPINVQEEGIVAVRDAIRILDSQNVDPGSRIIACYMKMVAAAASLGAPIGPELTARELEAGLRDMFMLSGPAIAELTRLFEEARYSLHVMTEADSQQAQRCLIDIGDELKAVSTQAIVGEAAAVGS